MDEEELLELMDSNDKPFKDHETKQDSNQKKNFKGNSLWDKTDFQPLKINVANLKKSSKSFTVSWYTEDRKIPEEDKEKIVKVCKALVMQGYKFRHNGSKDDEVQNAVLAIENIEVESYLPWSKFNENIKNPFMKYATEVGYRIATNYHKVYAKLPSTVRAIIASGVHSLLGKECIDPVDIFVCYSSTGEETVGKDTDFKKLGDLVLKFRVCSDANIPVFNMKKEDTISRIVAFIKNKEN